MLRFSRADWSELPDVALCRRLCKPRATGCWFIYSLSIKVPDLTALISNHSVCCFVLRIGFTVQLWLSWNSQRWSCLCLLHAEIKGKWQHRAAASILDRPTASTNPQGKSTIRCCLTPAAEGSKPCCHLSTLCLPQGLEPCAFTEENTGFGCIWNCIDLWLCFVLKKANILPSMVLFRAIWTHVLGPQSHLFWLRINSCFEVESCAVPHL